MTEPLDFQHMAREALAEVGEALGRVANEAASRLAEEILSTGTIVCFGLGREGLMVRAFCMRLTHSGFRAFMVGDVTTPPVGPGDLVLVSAGPGELKMAEAIVDLGRKAGARTLVVTAEPTATVPRKA